MTDDEFGIFKNYATFSAFFTKEGYPNATTLNQYRESVWSWMTKFIGNTSTRSTYNGNVQFQLRDIEYRGVELLISGEIAKNKIENYIQNAIIEIFGEPDKGELDAADESSPNRGVVEG